MTKGSNSLVGLQTGVSLTERVRAIVFSHGRVFGKERASDRSDLRNWSRYCRGLRSRGSSGRRHGRRRQEAEDAATLVRARSGEGIALVADVRSPAQIHEAIAFFVADRPGLSVAVNCAGLDVSRYLADYSVEELDRVFETNARGIFCCMQEEIALMRANGGGAMVNITSVAGLRPFLSNSVYNAKKECSQHAHSHRSCRGRAQWHSY
jgi:NAD(P)-dependent dehydrogenase (short-subunit alcohol dehydrogenase family)